MAPNYLLHYFLPSSYPVTVPKKSVESVMQKLYIEKKHLSKLFSSNVTH